MQLIVMRVHPTYLRNEDDLDVWSSCVSWDFANCLERSYVLG